MKTASKWKLHNLTARNHPTIKPRKKPYFVSVGPGLTLGYVKRPKGAVGSWVARRAVDRKETEGEFPHTYALYEQWTIGSADDRVPPDGTLVLSYQQAMTKAANEHHARKTGRASTIITVADAITHYLDWLDENKGESARKDAAGKLRKHVPPSLANLPLMALRQEDFERWKTAAVATMNGSEEERKQKDTWNRVRASFLAALNLAYKKKHVPTNEAWRDVKKFPKVAKPRTHHFSMEEVRRLIAHATPPAFRNFLEAGFLTGARAGELRELDVQHFDAATGQLYVAAERAGAKKTGPRYVSLTAEGVAFFASLTEQRKPDAPLLLDPNGARWPVGGQKKPMTRALKAAGLYRKDARGNRPCFYATRHTVISRTREMGGPDWLIGKNCGTSPAMIHDSYGKITPEQQRAMIAQFTPQLRGVDDAVA